MAILHIDGFDHYGTDTARMTEGVYDQVDVAFTLSEVNPRTGARCLRRDDSVAFSEIRRGLGVKRETVGAGVALNLSQLPDNISSYEVASILDENQIKHVRFYIQPDGSVQARSGVSNAVLASSSAGVIDAGRDLHFEFGVKADSGIEISTSMPGIQNAEFSGKSAQPSETSNDIGAEISDDGRYLYVLDHSPTSVVYQYEFGTVGDLDTISYTGRSLSVEAEVGARNAHSIAFGDSGRKIYVTEASTEFLTTYQYNLTTAWELDTGSYSGRSFNSGLAASYQVQFNLSGTKMFVLTDSTNDIRQYSLSSAWNIDTDSFDSVLFDYSSVLTDGHNFRFSKNGLRFYILGVVGNTIYQFSMPEGYDVANATYDEVSLSTEEQTTETHGFVLSFDESRIYVVDFVANDTIYEYLNSGTMDLSDGIIEVRVDGVTVISISDAKTIYSDDRFYSAVALHCGSGIAHGVTTDIDDFYIWDDQGAWNNSFIGDRRALLMKPNQDTNVADFDPSSGSFGYKMIDDDSPDDDSTYIIAEAYLQSGSPLTGTSEFEIEDLPNGVSLISAVNVVTRASKTDSTSAEIFTSINSDLDSLSQGSHVLTTSYKYYSDLYEHDPSTISSLTKDGFNLLSVSVTADDLDPGVVFDSPTDEDDAFSPDDIASLLRWYAADNLALSDNDPVSSWTDQSSFADHAVQATPTNKPTFKTGIINSLPVVRFITNDFLEFAEIFDTSGSNGTIFVVGKLRTGGAAPGAFLSTRPSGLSQGWTFRGNTLTAALYFHTGFSPSITLTHADQFNVLEVKRTGLNILTYVNGSASGSGTVSGFSASSYNKTSIGAEASAGSSFLDGDIAEIIIYGEALSDADRGNVETYLLDKYGIA